MPILHRLKHSGYSRTGIDTITTEMFGTAKITDSLTTEVMIISYDYASHEPRLFTKFSAENYDRLYDIMLKDAAQASSAAPVYFDPKIIGDQILIDGGVIANSPSLYSYLHAKYVVGKPKVRMISIGTGATQPEVLDPESMTTVTWLE